MPACFGWFGCNKGLCSDAHPFPQVLGLAGRLPAHTQHLHAAPRHLLQCGNGHWHVPRWEGGCREQPGCSPQGWVWTLGPAPGSLLPSVSCPVGGRGRAMVQPERPGDPTLLSRAPGPTEYQLLPAGCLVWGQLPAGAGHHPSRRGARGHPVSWVPTSHLHGWHCAGRAWLQVALAELCQPCAECHKALWQVLPDRPNPMYLLFLSSLSLSLSGWIWGHQPFLFPDACTSQALPEPALQDGGATRG